MSYRRLLGRMLAVIGAVVAGATVGTTAPEISPPPERERTIQISSSGLRIAPGTETVYLQFTGDVQVTAEDFELSADYVEVDVRPEDASNLTAFELPQVGEPEHLTRDPGARIRDMAQSIEVPRAQFSAGSLERFGAKGSVRVADVESSSILTTDELVSTDGGITWAAEGRSTLSRDPAGSQSQVVSADYLLFDTGSAVAVAWGNIIGTITDDAGSADVRASRMEVDLGQQRIAASGGIIINYGNFSLTCGTLEIGLAAGTATASEEPVLVESTSGARLAADELSVERDAGRVAATGDVSLSVSSYELELSAGSITADLNSRVITANEGVWARHSGLGVELTTAALTAELEAERLSATGNPELKYRSSSYSGERIVAERTGQETQITIEGQQYGTINLDDFEGLDFTSAIE
jgi:hypothetical protein